MRLANRTKRISKKIKAENIEDFIKKYNKFGDENFDSLCNLSSTIDTLDELSIFEPQKKDKRGWTDFEIYHEPTHDMERDVMRLLLEQKHMFKSRKPLFLDLGSGQGHMLIYAAHSGWKS